MHELQQPPLVPFNETLSIPARPVIETPRLLLRQHRLGDLAERVPLTTDPDFMRFVGGVYDRQENWARMLRYIGHWIALGYGLFAVEERATGRYAGNLGLARFERDLGADFDSCPEGAWWMAPWATGLGYATEGMIAVIDWYERTFGPSRMVCIIDEENAASRRVGAKLGFTPYRQGQTRGQDVTLFERALARSD
jgi:RimJ/RimL family protein N-acetyltransferase